jgi:hypothetical protein
MAQIKKQVAERQADGLRHDGIVLNVREPVGRYIAVLKCIIFLQVSRVDIVSAKMEVSRLLPCLASGELLVFVAGCTHAHHSDVGNGAIYTHIEKH